MPHTRGDRADERPASSPSTHFAPAGRATSDELRASAARVHAEPLLMQMLDALPTMVVILNRHRQIVAGNRAVAEAFQVDPDALLGLRPGESIGCIYAAEGPEGCGTAEHCAYCGAVDAVLSAGERRHRETRESRLQVHSPDGVRALDVRVTAAPLRVGPESLVMATLEDIGPAKRVEVMQRAVFHDLLALAENLRSCAELLEEEPEAEQDIPRRLCELSDQLVDEILVHREMAYAESGQLQTQFETVHTLPALERLRRRFLRHPAATGQNIELACAWNGPISTDRHLLHRVLGHMLRNALEASGLGDVVRLGCNAVGDRVVFSVHNDAVMPEEVAEQVFTRSFTTKGMAGRGVGTYLMRLFGEQYLGGCVDFTSRPGEGTTFRIALPMPQPGAGTHRG